jgi:signal transduction histidine kinase
MTSLRRQLTFKLLIAIVLLLGGGGALVYLMVGDFLRDQFDESLRVRALTVVTSTEQLDGRIRVFFSDQFLREFDDEVATGFFQVWSSEGETARRSDSLGERDLPLEFGSLDEPKVWNLSLPDGVAGRAIGIRFEPRVSRRDSGANPPVEAVVVVAAQRGHLDQALAALRNTLYGVGGALLIVTAVGVPRLLGRGMQPLERVAEQAERIDAGSLHVRFPVGAMPTELQPICARLNDLLVRLEGSFERERRFSSDIAHELRTPLAELRSLAEVALKWPDAATPAAFQASLEIVLQMEALATRLLALARAEHGRELATKQPVAVDSVIDWAWKSVAARATERALGLDREGVAGGLSIETDPALFRAIVSNLLANAAQYAPHGSTVRIHFLVTDGSFKLQVENLAPQLEAADLPRMFERFWRKDRARAGVENSGLGLALAQSFARLLDGEIVATLSAEGWLSMTLQGPAGATVAAPESATAAV